MTATLAERPTVVAVGEQEPTHWCPECNYGATCANCGSPDHHLNHLSHDESIRLVHDYHEPGDLRLRDLMVGLKQVDAGRDGVCGGRTGRPMLSFIAGCGDDTMAAGATPDEGDLFARHLLFFTACAHGLTIADAARLADSTLAKFRRARKAATR